MTLPPAAPPVPESPDAPRRPLLRRIWREWVLGAILPIWLLITFGFTLARVDGNSMNPTLHSGDVALLLKYPRWLRAWGLNGLISGSGYPRRGDIVVFRAPAGSEYAYQQGLFGRYRPYNIKRVVGLPGETVSVAGGQVRIDGKVLSEAYTSAQTPSDEPPVKVPAGSIYVLGDNRILGESVDSRFYGPVPLSEVAGPANLHLP
ncbi:signal peptidase I [Deinococcus sp.]|uniref:signal peptidase I n=1 Tax=Deinococcus sp. TaxID=47478 RepID=UPI003CC59E19